MQVVDGLAVPVEVKKGRAADGVFAKHARIIRKLIPIRDAVRCVLKLQERDQPWKQAQVGLRIAWSSFVREFGPINFTTVSTSEDPETGEIRETHRRPNLLPFLDDPDCWLVASIEDYDLETNTAKPGPIFSERVISPPPAPVITSALDALAVVLNERGHVDPDHIAELLHRDVAEVIEELGDAIFQDPATGAWAMADAYLSGAVRSKLADRPGRCSARSCIPAKRHCSGARPAGRSAAIGYHRTARRPLDPGRRCRCLRQRDHGGRYLYPPSAGTGDLDRQCPATGMVGRRHHRMGHPSPARRPALVRCFELVGSPDFRHHPRWRDRAPGPEHRGDGSGQGKARQDQGRFPVVDLVGSRSHRPAGAGLQRHLQQYRAAAFQRRSSPATGRLRRLFFVRASETRHLADHLRRLDLSCPCRRRRQDADHGGRRSWSSAGSG